MDLHFRTKWIIKAASQRLALPPNNGSLWPNHGPGPLARCDICGNNEEFLEGVGSKLSVSKLAATCFVKHSQECISLKLYCEPILLLLDAKP